MKEAEQKYSVGEEVKYETPFGWQEGKIVSLSQLICDNEYIYSMNTSNGWYITLLSKTNLIKK